MYKIVWHSCWNFDSEQEVVSLCLMRLLKGDINYYA